MAVRNKLHRGYALWNSMRDGMVYVYGMILITFHGQGKAVDGCCCQSKIVDAGSLAIKQWSNTEKQRNLPMVGSRG